jgi:hypothetical protein
MSNFLSRFKESIYFFLPLTTIPIGKVEKLRWFVTRFRFEKQIASPIGNQFKKILFNCRIRGSPSRIRPVTIKLEPESVEELLGNSKSSEAPRFGSRNRNRFRDRVQPTRRQVGY